MLQGLSVSPGIAVGRAVIARFGGIPAFRRTVSPEEFEEEERRLRRAARHASEDFMKHSRQSSGEMGPELGAILEAHGLMAEDETFLAAIVEQMRRERVNAEWALAAVTRDFERRLEAADFSAMRERAADITDVAREMARQLSSGEPLRLPELPRGSILVADELAPVDVARLDPRRVRALALERGGPTSHAAIVAREFGVPCVVNARGATARLVTGTVVEVDGATGEVTVLGA